MISIYLTIEKHYYNLIVTGQRSINSNNYSKIFSIINWNLTSWIKHEQRLDIINYDSNYILIV